MGVRCADGVILGVEKLMVSKMLVKSSNKRVQLVDEHVGIAAAGIAADARALTNFARQIAKKYRQNYGDPIPPAVLAQQLADVMYAYTSYGAYRPFGASAVIAGFDEEKKAHELYMCEVDGTFHVRRVPRKWRGAGSGERGEERGGSDRATRSRSHRSHRSQRSRTRVARFFLASRAAVLWHVGGQGGAVGEDGH